MRRKKDVIYYILNNRLVDNLKKNADSDIEEIHKELEKRQRWKE